MQLDVLKWYYLCCLYNINALPDDMYKYMCHCIISGNIVQAKVYVCMYACMYVCVYVYIYIYV